MRDVRLNERTPGPGFFIHCLLLVGICYCLDCQPLVWCATIGGITFSAGTVAISIFSCVRKLSLPSFTACSLHGPSLRSARVSRLDHYQSLFVGGGVGIPFLCIDFEDVFHGIHGDKVKRTRFLLACVVCQPMAATGFRVRLFSGGLVLVYPSVVSI